MVVAEPSTSDCNVVVAQTTAVVQTVFAALAVPPMNGASFDGILPSHSTFPLFYPRENYMLDNPCLHHQQIDKMYNTNL